jgi:L-fucose mutarotase
MIPEDERQHPIHHDFHEILGGDTHIQGKKRQAFYEDAYSQTTCLAIATGESRRFANILIVIGSIKLEDILI